MNATESTTSKKRSSLKWPVCTLLFLIGIGALGYWTYSKYQEERAMVTTGRSVSSPAVPSDINVGPLGQGTHTYRTELPMFFLVGFAAVMIGIMGTILYFWWSLKDWEGGKKYGEDEPPQAGDPS